MPARFRLLLLLLGLLGSTGGCATARPPASSTPVVVRANNPDFVLDRSVDVVHDYFEISREKRSAGSQPGLIDAI
ncbi:MAG: hypothetical protein EHM42_15965 [Planctomycetaceae bacterium]|nr:MAG: hypothetical protein EHM42_15965 [Planctomycetaceae bacterium]